jgi:hypothetical protein
VTVVVDRGFVYFDDAVTLSELLGAMGRRPDEQICDDTCV